MRETALRLIVFVAASTALALAGCGGGDGGEGAAPDTATIIEPTPSSTTVTATKTTDTTEPEPEPPLDPILDPILDPGDLLPQLSDLPAGYSIEETRSRSLAETLEGATEEQAAVVRRERVAGHEITFESPSLELIICRTTVYRSSAGAREVFEIALEQVSTEAPEGGKLEPANLDDPIGDEAAAFSGQFEGSSTFTVVWRHRNLGGSCASGGLVTTDPEDTMRVARAQQKRMEEAAR